MQKGLVSILMANFDKDRYLENTLSSILEQEYKNWECIIVDDGSTDSSRKILHDFQKRDSRFKVFDRPKHIPKGSNFCRNFAYGLASGDYIQWFDSDDIMYPWFIKMKVETLESNQEVPFVVTKADLKFEEEFDGNRKFTQTLSSQNLISDYLRFRILFFTGAPLFRKHVFEEVGLFNENLYRHQEWELYLRVLLRFRDFEIIKKVGYAYYVVSKSITSSYQDRHRILMSELELFLQVLSRNTNPLKQVIPQKERVRIAFKYFLVATYHRKFSFSLTYFERLILELVSPTQPLETIDN
ncbi:glycosyltransferase family 2 protein [Algoriphagus marinus]|uniref:glycosyltransferase family 2 protein n=1 Tax=Algoriphagus marinus TaxID=1925762 RepID=UPI00094B9A27|nr:glycosyltransferase family A protein [Algoriphagus marinus]